MGLTKYIDWQIRKTPKKKKKNSEWINYTRDHVRVCLKNRVLCNAMINSSSACDRNKIKQIELKNLILVWFQSNAWSWLGQARAIHALESSSARPGIKSTSDSGLNTKPYWVRHGKGMIIKTTQMGHVTPSYFYIDGSD
jgi:hypothetical protein